MLQERFERARTRDRNREVEPQVNPPALVAEELLAQARQTDARQARDASYDPLQASASLEATAAKIAEDLLQIAPQTAGRTAQNSRYDPQLAEYVAQHPLLQQYAEQRAKQHEAKL